MSDLSNVRERLKEISQRQNNVTIADIEGIVADLGAQGYRVRSRQAGDHGILFAVDNVRFGVCTHRRGSKQLKRCYVKEFLKKMIELGVYE